MSESIDTYTPSYSGEAYEEYQRIRSLPFFKIENAVTHKKINQHSYICKFKDSSTLQIDDHYGFVKVRETNSDFIDTYKIKGETHIPYDPAVDKKQIRIGDIIRIKNFKYPKRKGVKRVVVDFWYSRISDEIRPVIQGDQIIQPNEIKEVINVKYINLSLPNQKLRGRPVEVKLVLNKDNRYCDKTAVLSPKRGEE